MQVEIVNSDLTVMHDKQPIYDEWFYRAVEDAHAIIVEAVFTSRWALIEGYHLIGERIVTDENFQKYGKGNQIVCVDLANGIGVSLRTLYRAIQFYEKYPRLDLVPEGKNISWNKLVNNYLPSPTEENTPNLPNDKKYRVIYADPPWTYNSGDQHCKDAPQVTVLEDHYNSMSIDDLCNLPVKELAHNNAVLFLWVTSPLLEECFEVIKAWGFEYKTSMVWDKQAHNAGYYVSVRHEFLLICTRGSCRPDVDQLLPSVVSEKRTGHSVKPETFRRMIDTMYPEGKRIELFARIQVPRWDRWGTECL